MLHSISNKRLFSSLCDLSMLFFSIPVFFFKNIKNEVWIVNNLIFFCSLNSIGLSINDNIYSFSCRLLMKLFANNVSFLYFFGWLNSFFFYLENNIGFFLLEISIFFIESFFGIMIQNLNNENDFFLLSQNSFSFNSILFYIMLVHNLFWSSYIYCSSIFNFGVLILFLLEENVYQNVLSPIEICMLFFIFNVLFVCLFVWLLWNCFIETAISEANVSYNSFMTISLILSDNSNSFYFLYISQRHSESIIEIMELFIGVLSFFLNNKNNCFTS